MKNKVPWSWWDEIKYRVTMLGLTLAMVITIIGITLFIMLPVLITIVGIIILIKLIIFLL